MGYTNERHTQILIALLKTHNIKKVVASPGTTNVCFVGSIQNDPFFEIYSSVDERSAAYIACGMARETGEPVILSCTGATASRNYIPGLTEAFYSNLPILAVTSTQHPGRIGHLNPQVLDRTTPLNDIVRKSIQLNAIYTSEDEWAAEISINEALLELRRYNCGPVHINLMSTYSSDYSVKVLPQVKVVQRYFYDDNIPSLAGKKIYIYVGSHKKWDYSLTETVDDFCEKYNAAVVCEHISNYRGKYGVNPVLLSCQHNSYEELNCDIMIHLGTVAGFGSGAKISAEEVWRVNPDGELRDTFKKLTKVFEMDEEEFFHRYCLTKQDKNKTSNVIAIRNKCKEIIEKIGDIPFSNVWIAKNTVDVLPSNCELHLGILNSLRSWTLFEIDNDKRIDTYSNPGGFGIDGMISTLVGSSIVAPEKLFLGVIGDLAFFYDMNALGNRHIKGNFRLMVVNNGRGTEFRLHDHPANQFGDDADRFMAAAGHYGCKSRTLIKDYAQDLGFEYLSADNKEQYMENMERFISEEKYDRPLVFEIFTNSEDESNALDSLCHIDTSTEAAVKDTIKGVIGEKNVSALKRLFKRD